MNKGIDEDGYKYDDPSDPDFPVGPLTIIEDSQLPSPEVMARALKRIKITMNATPESLEFYKKEAEKHGVSYQALMRQVLDDYARAAQSNPQNNR